MLPNLMFRHPAEMTYVMVTVSECCHKKGNPSKRERRKYNDMLDRRLL